MIAILDYGGGNLRSVENTLAEIGVDYQLVRDPGSLRSASKIVFPGQGHFAQMMRALDANGVLPVLRERIEKRVPFLGICLGLQALFEASEEAPDVKGLGLFPGTVKRFPAGARVPQMGWNQLEVRGEPRLLHGIGSKPYVYFAHSYYAPVVNETAATTTYEVPYTSAVEAGTVFGVQFHPEKSGPTGLRIMRNFLEV